MIVSSGNTIRELSDDEVNSIEGGAMGNAAGAVVVALGAAAAAAFFVGVQAGYALGTVFWGPPPSPPPNFA